MFKEHVEGLKTEIDKERNERQEMEKVIINLLETTCEKISEFNE